jgi:hypothetical protein
MAHHGSPSTATFGYLNSFGGVAGIESGDRVLLAAEPTEGVLTVHPLIVMDTMVTRFHAQVMAGDAT